MNVNFEAIEKAWFKPKNKILFTKEELELLENVFSLAIGECPSEDIKKINELEQKIKIYSGTWFKPKNNFEEYIKKQCIHNEYKIDYEYFKTLFSKSTKEDVLMALTEKCEELQRLNISYYKLLCKEYVKNNIISELEEWCRKNKKIASESLSILISGTEQAKRMATRFVVYDEFLNKIQELKKENKNGRIF